MWTITSREGVPSTLRIPSSSLRREAASSKRAAAASHGFFSFSSDIETGKTGGVTVSLCQCGAGHTRGAAAVRAILKPMPDWNPGQYLRFADQRTQPCRELVARIHAGAPATV